MHSVLKKLALASALVGMLAASPAFSQTEGLGGSESIVTLTTQNEADVVNAANDMDILAAIGSPSFFRSHQAEMAGLATLHKSKLLVVYADPSTISGADAIVSQLTGGDHGYPMILYLGANVRKLKRQNHAGHDNDSGECRIASLVRHGT